MDEKQNTPTTLPTEKQPKETNITQSSQEATQKKTPKKWLTIGLIVFALVALGAIGILTYQNYQSKGEATLKESFPSPTPTEVISPTPKADPTVNWLTYAEENICYSFKYPKEVTLKKEDVIHLSLWGPTQKKDTEFYDGISLSFSFPLKIGNVSLKDYVDSKIEEAEKSGVTELVKPREEITINGINGYTYTIQGLGKFQNILLQSPNKTCTVEITNATRDPTNQDYQKTVDTTLSTFKFIN